MEKNAHFIFFLLLDGAIRCELLRFLWIAPGVFRLGNPAFAKAFAGRSARQIRASRGKTPRKPRIPHSRFLVREAKALANVLPDLLLGRPPRLRLTRQFVLFHTSLCIPIYYCNMQELFLWGFLWKTRNHPAGDSAWRLAVIFLTLFF